jgi:hypothetical protein
MFNSQYYPEMAPNFASVKLGIILGIAQSDRCILRLLKCEESRPDYPALADWESAEEQARGGRGEKHVDAQSHGF